MHKKALLALMLVMTMLLSSCALIEKDENVDNATVVVRVYDTEITKGEIESRVAYELEYMAYMYQSFGMAYDITDPVIIADTQATVIDEMIKEVVIRHKITELGIDQFDAEQQAQLEANASAAMSDYRDQLKNVYFANTELSDEEVDKQLTDLLAAMGITDAAVMDDEKFTMCKTLLREKLHSEATFTEEDVVAYYDGLIENDISAWSMNPENFATSFNNGLKIYYYPEGFRLVKQILVAFTEDEQAEISSLQSKVNSAKSNITSLTATLESQDPALVESLKSQVVVTITIPESGKASEAEAFVDAPFGDDVDAVLGEQVKQLVMSEEALEFYSSHLDTIRTNAIAAIDVRADEILAELEAGADWDTLMLEKTEDPGMQADAITSDTGYAVCAGMTTFDAPFVDAAMALENVGDVSGKVLGSYGYYIIKYVADVEPGAVPLEDVRPTVESSVLATAKGQHYDAVLAQWVEEAKPSINMDALKD